MKFFNKESLIAALFFSTTVLVFAILITLSMPRNSEPSIYILMRESVPIAFSTFISTLLIWKNTHSNVFIGGLKGILIAAISLLLLGIVASIMKTVNNNSSKNFIEIFQHQFFWVLVASVFPILLGFVNGIIISLILKTPILKKQINTK